MTLKPTMLGYVEIPDGCSRLQFAPAHNVKVTRLLAWGAKRESALLQVRIGGQRQLVHRLPLGLFESSVAVDRLEHFGALKTLAGTEGPIFFHLTNISNEGTEEIGRAGRAVDFSAIGAGFGVSIDIEGPVTALGLFGEEWWASVVGLREANA